MNIAIARMYTALLIGTISTVLQTSVKRIFSAYDDVYCRENITAVAAISTVLGVAATIAAPFVMPMVWWQYPLIIPAVMVTGTVVITAAQTVATMMVEVGSYAWSLVRRAFTAVTA